MKHFASIDDTVVEDVKMVRFRLNGGWDYVWVTYHDVKGFISITSSYGNWSYIWSSMGKDVTLREFFLTADKFYLSGKFWADSKIEKHTFDAADALKDIRKELLSDRRERSLTKVKAREIMDELKEFEYFLDSNYENNRDIFFKEFASNHVLTSWNEEWYDNRWGQSVKGSFLVLRDEIIPLIKDHFAKTTAEEATKVYPVIKTITNPNVPKDTAIMSNGNESVIIKNLGE